MHNLIDFSIKQALQGIEHLNSPTGKHFLQESARVMEQTIRSGGKILLAGNGGSLAEAIHFAEELTGRYRKTRPPFAALALADSSHITCTTNDMGFDEIFSRPLMALGHKEDLFIALSTSGNSKNLVTALEVSKKIGMASISLLGKDGGLMRGMSTIEWIVDGPTTSDRIQEAHLVALHIMIELFEHLMGCA